MERNIMLILFYILNSFHTLNKNEYVLEIIYGQTNM